MREVWEVIPSNPKYRVSDRGSVYSMLMGRNLSLSDNKGYKVVNLGKGNLCKVHRLVMMAFFPREDAEKLQVNHLDGDKANNSLDNLEWSTCSDNIKHAFSIGLKSQRGSRNNQAKLIEPQVAFIKKMISDKRFGYKELAKMFSVSRQCINDIALGRRWSHVEEQQ
jgi:hypothetical protein